MIFCYDKQTGQVTSYSEKGGNKYSEKFQEIELSPTPEELNLMKQNYDLFIQKNTLVCVKPDRLILEEKTMNVEMAKVQLQEKIAGNKATLNDVLLFLKEL